MTDPIELLTARIKEVYISREIFDMKEQMESADRLNKEISGYVKYKLLINRDMNNIDDIMNIYKNINDENQNQLIWIINEYCILYYKTYNKYGKMIIDEFITAIELLDSDYEIDDIELVNVMAEDRELDRQFEEQYDNEDVDMF